MFCSSCWARKLVRWLTVNVSFQKKVSFLTDRFLPNIPHSSSAAPCSWSAGKRQCSSNYSREKESSSPRKSAEESGRGRLNQVALGNLDKACVTWGPTRALSLMDFWLCSQGFSGWAPQWLEGKINLGSFIILSLWLKSSGEGVCSDGSDKLLVSGPGGFSLWLFFQHEQHLAVAVGVKRGLEGRGRRVLLPSELLSGLALGWALCRTTEQWSQPSSSLPSLLPHCCQTYSYLLDDRSQRFHT